MNVRRVLLSAALVGGCAWCLGLVQQVQSQQGAGPVEQRSVTVEAPNAQGDIQVQTGPTKRAEAGLASDNAPSRQKG